MSAAGTTVPVDRASQHMHTMKTPSAADDRPGFLIPARTNFLNSSL